MQEHRTQSPAPWLGLFLAAIWAAGDLVSKAAVEAWLMARPSAQQTLAPYLDLTLSHNRGVTFGLFNAAGTSSLLILGLTGAIAAVLAVLILRGRRPVPTLCLGLVLGGALGNIVDRARDGAVTDFLDFHIAGAHWPAFNIADVGVVVGLAGFVISDLASSRRRRPAG